MSNVSRKEEVSKSRARHAGKPHGYLWKAVLADIETFMQRYRSGISMSDLAELYGTTEGTLSSNIFIRLRKEGLLKDEDTKKRMSNMKRARKLSRINSRFDRLAKLTEDVNKLGTEYLGLSFLLKTNEQLLKEFGCKDYGELASLRERLIEIGAIRRYYTYEFIAKEVLCIDTVEKWYEYFKEFPLQDEYAYGVIHALNTLSEKEQTVVVSVAKGFSYSDIGELIGVGSSRVGQIRFKARCKLMCKSRKIFIELGRKEALKKLENKKPSMELGLAQLELSTRPYLALRRVGVNTIEDVIALYKSGYINDVRNLGRVSYNEVVAQFARQGIELDTSKKCSPYWESDDVTHRYQLSIVELAHEYLSKQQ